MADHVYKKLELAGSSTTGIEEAVSNAVAKAAKTIHNLRWFEVSEIRGGIDNGTITHGKCR